MHGNCNPAPEAGERNVFCPYYDHCLDHAIKKAWNTWDCAHCVHRFMSTQMTEVIDREREASPHYTIPLAVERFLQEAYL